MFVKCRGGLVAPSGSSLGRNPAKKASAPAFRCSSAREGTFSRGCTDRLNKLGEGARLRSDDAIVLVFDVVFPGRVFS